MQHEKQDQQQETIDVSKRSLLKVSYVAPAIITLSALPSFASAGSGYKGGDHQARWDQWEPKTKFGRLWKNAVENWWANRG